MHVVDKKALSPSANSNGVTDKIGNSMGSSDLVNIYGSKWFIKKRSPLADHPLYVPYTFR